jgi:hypothetical protein
MPDRLTNNPAIDGRFDITRRHEGGGQIASAGPPQRHEDLGSGVLQLPGNQTTDGAPASDAIVTLETLRCLELTNLEKRAEPYIWPALIWVDSATIKSAQPIVLSTISQGEARRVVKNSMGVGETAPIPPSVATLRVRFDPTVDEKHLIVVVGLLENDETPIRATRAGFRAFVSALTSEVTSHLAALDAASDEERDVIIDEIKERVAAAVESAVRGNLTSSEKFEVFVGSLDPDDTLGAGFVALDNEEVVSRPMSVTIEQTGRLKPPLPPAPTRSRFQVRGRLRIQPVVVDPCRQQVQAVNDAQAVVNAINGQIEELQDQLTGDAEDVGSAPPGDIVELIRQLREEELVPAVAALEAARAALARCRTDT